MASAIVRNIFVSALYDMITPVNVCVWGGKDIIYWTIIIKNVYDSFIHTDLFIYMIIENNLPPRNKRNSQRIVAKRIVN